MAVYVACLNIAYACRMMGAQQRQRTGNAGIHRLAIEVQRNGKHAVLHHADSAVEAALLDRAGCVPQQGRGRGEVFRFPLHDGWGILRPYRRGGAIRFLIKDAYLLDNRPLREWAVHTYLFEQGFAVAEPLGVVWEKRGIAYRGAIATREVIACDLGEFALAHSEHWKPLMELVGVHVRAMHDLGVYHADLQIKNILVTRDSGSLVFIDWDNARRSPSVSPMQRSRNLLRLRRSCEKNGLDPSCFDAIRKGYGTLRVPVWLEALYRWKGGLSDAAGSRKRRHAG
ncbi:MAG: hypothetical protein IT364_20655 [Candidatus Hydrogenedentes bacterium]|nr:hypothetical protein [Candidatus Hydrogenedentota bacterium]